jgi:hypothetical protein
MEELCSQLFVNCCSFELGLFGGASLRLDGFSPLARCR